MSLHVLAYNFKRLQWCGSHRNWTPCVPPAVLLRIYIYGYLHNYLSASIGMGLVQRRSSGR